MANDETTKGGCSWETMLGARGSKPLGFVRCGRPVTWRVTDGKTGKVSLLCSSHKGLVMRRYRKYEGHNPLAFVPVP